MSTLEVRQQKLAKTEGFGVFKDSELISWCKTKGEADTYVKNEQLKEELLKKSKELERTHKRGTSRIPY